MGEEVVSERPEAEGTSVLGAEGEACSRMPAAISLNGRRNGEGSEDGLFPEVWPESSFS
jgi:hypothetical protein